MDTLNYAGQGEGGMGASAPRGQPPQRQRVMQYIQDRYGTEPEYLWAKYPSYAVFRQPASRKWFAAVMDLPRGRLGLEGTETVNVMNVKCGPLMVGSLLAQEGFLPAYHMSKAAWISVLLDETVPDNQIYPLLELSYDNVKPKAKKRCRGGS